MMNKKYDAKINMFIQVENALDKYQAIVDSSPALKSAAVHVTGQLDIIEEKKQPLSLVSTGIAEDKQDARLLKTKFYFRLDIAEILAGYTWVAHYYIAQQFFMEHGVPPGQLTKIFSEVI